jgi:hypothetical protein
VLLATVLVAPFALPVLATLPLPSGTLGDVADRFDPGDGATFRSASSEPRRLWCLGGDACPSTSRSWDLGGPPSTREVQIWITGAGYDAVVDGDCSTGSCRAHGTADGWDVDVYVFAEHFSGSARLSLSLR